MVGRVGDQRCRLAADRLQPHAGHTLEDSGARAEDDRGDVQAQFVDQSRRQVLVDGRGPAGDRDGSVSRRLSSLRERRVDAVGDEVEGGAALHRHRIMRVMGQDVDRRVIWRILAPPTAPVLVPFAADRAEHVPAHDVGAGRGDELDLGGVALRLLEHPPVEGLATLTEWDLPALLRASDEAVE